MRKEAKLILLGAGAIGLGLLSREAVSAIDQAMTPKFVVEYKNWPIPEPTPEWQRPTRWR